MGESGLEATVRHHGETLVRLERKVDDGLKELRGDFKFLLGGMGALGLLIVAAAVGVVEYSSPSPIDARHFKGGYTITVTPLSESGSPAASGTLGAAQSSAPSASN